MASHDGVPHSLAVAHERLRATLDSGIEQFKRNGRFTNAADVCQTIERFVDELYRIPGCDAELLRRAVFVKEQCKPGSTFDRSREKALGGYARCVPVKKAEGLHLTPQGHLATWLGRIQSGQESLSEVAQLRQQLELAIRLGVVAEDARPSFADLLAEIGCIQHEAARLEADGCYFLWHVYATQQGDAPEHSRAVKSIMMDCQVGGAHLESIRAAAASMMAFAGEESQAVDAESDATRRSTDFRSVSWFGEVYSFTANQAPVVKLLYENWIAGTPDVGDETLLLAVDPEAPPARLATLFRDHPAWGTMIVAGGSKGTHRLAKSAEESP